MTSLQIMVQIFTWLFLYTLHSRTLRRSEISRLKEQIVESLSKYPTWLMEILEKPNIEISDVDNYVASAIARFDFQSTNLNCYAKCQIFPIENLAKLGGIEIKENHLSSTPDKKNIEKQAFNITSDLIEETEISYAKKMHNENTIRMLTNEYMPEIKGVICTLLILHMSYSLIKILVI
ncbi:hypothetical protein [Shewanella sp. Isolate11]|uniref:hypothetical protein n=1 Tax=Shewanella sp. Isolate11 TaxID=2908530 RepID=UPI001EFDB778|nr:hypothetical protein [Shewanella sp. Isolate11]MCG9697440.1 hypothetical protein [Shewanella sp. Isolate11]